MLWGTQARKCPQSCCRLKWGGTVCCTDRPYRWPCLASAHGFLQIWRRQREELETGRKGSQQRRREFLHGSEANAVPAVIRDQEADLDRSFKTFNSAPDRDYMNRHPPSMTGVYLYVYVGVCVCVSLTAWTSKSSPAGDIKMWALTACMTNTRCSETKVTGAEAKPSSMAGYTMCP